MRIVRFLMASRPRWLAPAATVVVLLGSACGSGSPSTGNADVSTGTCNLAAAKSRLDANTALPQFTPPGPPLTDPAKLNGKRVLFIPALSGIPLNLAVAAAAVDAGKRVGVTVTVSQNQGQPSQWVQAINQAIAQKYDAVILLDIDPRNITPQVAALQQAHIPAVEVWLYDENDQRFQVSPFSANSVEEPYSLAARLEADAAIVQTNCKANAVYFDSPEFLNFQFQSPALVDEFKTICPGCKVTTYHVPALDWTTKLSSTVATALNADPSVNWVIPGVDPEWPYVKAGMISAGRLGNVGVSTFNGTPDALAEISTGVITTDASAPATWNGWAEMDQVFRILLGMDTVREKTPLRVFTKDNVADAGNPPTFTQGFGDAYVSGYLKLWGVNS